MRSRAWWLAGVVVMALVVGVPVAGAATVSGSLTVTGMTTSSVSFTVTGQRTCDPTEQCDYYADLENLDGAGPCPSQYPQDPWNIWNGDVQNTGPTTETGTITPRHWLETPDPGTSMLCLYIYADYAYYLVGGTTINRPPGAVVGGAAPPRLPPGAPGSPSNPGTGTTTPGTTPAGGGAAGGKITCSHYTYQQQAQQALAKDKSLAATLDPDHDGVACQQLPKRITYVTTLASTRAATSARSALSHAFGTSYTQRSALRSRCARTARTRMRCTVSWTHRGATYKGYVDVAGVIRKNKQSVLTHVHVKTTKKSTT